MLYFFHHYELPVILEQAQLQHLFYGNHAPPTQPPTSSTIHRTSRSLPTSTTSTNANSSFSTSELTQQNYITELSLLDSDLNNFQGNHRPDLQSRSSDTNIRDRSEEGTLLLNSCPSLFYIQVCNLLK